MEQKTISQQINASLLNRQYGQMKAETHTSRVWLSRMLELLYDYGNHFSVHSPTRNSGMRTEMLLDYFDSDEKIKAAFGKPLVSGPMDITGVFYQSKNSNYCLPANDASVRALDNYLYHASMGIEVVLIGIQKDIHIMKGGKMGYFDKVDPELLRMLFGFDKNWQSGKIGEDHYEGSYLLLDTRGWTNPEAKGIDARIILANERPEGKSIRGDIGIMLFGRNILSLEHLENEPFATFYKNIEKEALRIYDVAKEIALPPLIVCISFVNKMGSID